MFNTIYNNILSEELVLSLQQSIDKELSRREIKNIIPKYKIKSYRIN